MSWRNKRQLQTECEKGDRPLVRGAVTVLGGWNVLEMWGSFSHHQLLTAKSVPAPFGASAAQDLASGGMSFLKRIPVPCLYSQRCNLAAVQRSASRATSRVAHGSCKAEESPCLSSFFSLCRCILGKLGFGFFPDAYVSKKAWVLVSPWLSHRRHAVLLSSLRTSFFFLFLLLIYFPLFLRLN